MSKFIEMVWKGPNGFVPKLGRIMAAGDTFTTSTPEYFSKTATLAAKKTKSPKEEN